MVFLTGDEVYKYHTDPTKVDTNGNGLSDYEEALVFGQDPTADLNMINFEKLMEISGAAFVDTVGSWKVLWFFCGSNRTPGNS